MSKLELLTGEFPSTKRKRLVLLNVSNLFTHIEQTLYYFKTVEKSSAGKNKYVEYRKKLTGKLEYQQPSADITHFEGYLKLKKDPKTEQLSMENVLLRGSILRNTDW